MYSAQCYVPVWMGEGFKREWVHAYLMAESLHYLPETTTTLLIGYTPIQIGFGVKKKLKRIVLHKKVAGSARVIYRYVHF